jgi:hypothetical protein
MYTAYGVVAVVLCAGVAIVTLRRRSFTGAAATHLVERLISGHKDAAVRIYRGSSPNRSPHVDRPLFVTVTVERIQATVVRSGVNDAPAVQSERRANRLTASDFGNP